MNYRDKNPMYYSARESVSQVDAGLRAYMLHVYNLMASALLLTGIVAYFAAQSEAFISALYTHDGVHIGLSNLGVLVTFAPLAFVLVLNFGIARMSLYAAQATFWAFAVVMGLSLSSVFLLYTGESITRVFFISGIMFGLTSIWGYSTKRDLTGMGHFLFMGVIGIFVASLVNFWLQSPAVSFAYSVIGVIVFTGLLAYKTQAIKAMYYELANNSTQASKYAIMGALTLYISFLNLFLSLMRLMGNRR